MELFFYNILFNNNTGRILSASNFILIENDIYIYNQICNDKMYEGCIMYLERDSIVNSSNITIKNVDSNLPYDLLVASNCVLLLDNYTITAFFFN